ncbi:MAG TPA: hypothetical protein VII06_26865 [Chloroflexota bacterium]|jgi:hypothetical protein
MPPVEYHFCQTGQARSLLYSGVLDALSKALHDLHEHTAEPVALTWGSRQLYDAAAIRRVDAACRTELEADQWHRPPSLEAAARRELGR